MSKAQQAFIHQYTWSLMVKWAAIAVQGGDLGFRDKPPEKRGLFLEYAMTKGWVRQDLTDLTAKGYGIATSFLKR